MYGARLGCWTRLFTHPSSVGSDPVRMSLVSPKRKTHLVSLTLVIYMQSGVFGLKRRQGVKEMMAEPRQPPWTKLPWFLWLVRKASEKAKERAASSWGSGNAVHHSFSCWSCLLLPLFFQNHCWCIRRGGQKHRHRAGADRSILRDALVILYNFIGLIPEQDNESVTCKTGLLGGVKACLAQGFTRPWALWWKNRFWDFSYRKQIQIRPSYGKDMWLAPPLPHPPSDFITILA